MDYTTILVPVDFSEASRKAATKAGQIKNQCGNDCRVVLLHVIDYVPPSHIQVELPDNLLSQPRLIAGAEEQLQKLRQGVGMTDAVAVVKTGHPGEVILREQKNIGADLIIMAKHSRSGLERMLGSTTNSVANKVPCELLVLPD